MKSAMPIQRAVSATEARAHFGQVVQNVCEGNEHVIVERDGIPVIAILPIAKYHRLIKIGHFERLAYYYYETFSERTFANPLYDGIA